MTGVDVLLFIGPTLFHGDASELGSVEIRPPIKNGDLYRLKNLDCLRIVIVDGLYYSDIPIRHKELQWAAHHAQVIVGAGSLGALRAADLALQGMHGVGWVYEHVKSASLFDDADVALLHGTEEERWRPYTVPMVELEFLREVGRLDAGAYEELASIMWFERDLRRCVELGVNLESLDRKWRDAVDAVRYAQEFDKGGSALVEPYFESSFDLRARLSHQNSVDPITTDLDLVEGALLLFDGIDDLFEDGCYGYTNLYFPSTILRLLDGYGEGALLALAKKLQAFSSSPSGLSLRDAKCILVELTEAWGHDVPERRGFRDVTSVLASIMRLKLTTK